MKRTFVPVKWGSMLLFMSIIRKHLIICKTLKRVTDITNPVSGIHDPTQMDHISFIFNSMYFHSDNIFFVNYVFVSFCSPLGHMIYCKFNTINENKKNNHITSLELIH